MKYFLAASDRQLGICLRMLYGRWNSYKGVDNRIAVLKLGAKDQALCVFQKRKRPRLICVVKISTNS